MLVLAMTLLTGCKEKREVNPEAVKAVMAMPLADATKQKDALVEEMVKLGDLTPREHLKCTGCQLKGNVIISRYEFDDSDDLEDFAPDALEKIKDFTMRGFMQSNNVDLLKALVRTKTTFEFRIVSKKTKMMEKTSITLEELESCL